MRSNQKDEIRPSIFSHTFRFSEGIILYHSLLQKKVFLTEEEFKRFQKGDSREHIDLIRGLKTEDWAVGFVSWGTVFILHPDKFETESIHKKKEFYQVLKHELVHTYYGIICQTYKPVWLHEGIAVFLAGQCLKKMPLEKVVRVKKYFKKHSKEVYNPGGKLVTLLYDRFRKKKLLKLIKSINSNTTKKQFEGNFKKIYGFDLNKKELIKNLSDNNK